MLSFPKIIGIHNKFGLYSILSNMLYKIECSKIKNYFRRDKINLEKLLLIVKSILLGLFLFGTGMAGMAIRCFLMRRYTDFKESFRFYCISCFIISLIIVFVHLYKSW